MIVQSRDLVATAINDFWFAAGTLLPAEMEWRDLFAAPGNGRDFVDLPDILALLAADYVHFLSGYVRLREKKIELQSLQGKVGELSYLVELLEKSQGRRRPFVHCGASLLKIAAAHAALAAPPAGPSPVEPLIEEWQRRAVAARIPQTEPDLRTSGRRMPDKLAMVEPGRRARQRALVNGGASGAGGGIGAPAVALRPGPGGASASVSATSIARVRGVGAWQDAGVASPAVGTGWHQRDEWRWPGGSARAAAVCRVHPGPTPEMAPRRSGLRNPAVPVAAQAVPHRFADEPARFLRASDARCGGVGLGCGSDPWYDPRTGKGDRRRVVNLTGLPHFPEVSDAVVRVVIDLPPNSQAGPQVSDNLGTWGLHSAPAYRAMLNLAYLWYEPGRTHYPLETGYGPRWVPSHDPEQYEPVTNVDLIGLCYPNAVVSRNRHRQLERSLEALQQLEEAGEVVIVPVGTSGRERRILPPHFGSS